MGAYWSGGPVRCIVLLPTPLPGKQAARPLWLVLKGGGDLATSNFRIEATGFPVNSQRESGTYK